MWRKTGERAVQAVRFIACASEPLQRKRIPSTRNIDHPRHPSLKLMKLALFAIFLSGTTINLSRDYIVIYSIYTLFCFKSTVLSHSKLSEDVLQSHYNSWMNVTIGKVPWSMFKAQKSYHSDVSSQQYVPDAA